MPATVLFDLDDTLFDHTFCSRRALESLAVMHPVLARDGLEHLFDVYGAVLEDVHQRLVDGELSLEEARILRFERFFGEFGVRLGRPDARRLAAEYREAYCREWRPVAGAVELLSRLAPRVRLGIVSNNLAAEQTEKLRVCALAGHVEVVVVSEEAGVAKPDPRIFHLALERLDARPEEAVMVGDSWAKDVCGARAAGLRAVWFNPRRLAPPDPIEQLHALTPVEQVAALLAPD